MFYPNSGRAASREREFLKDNWAQVGVGGVIGGRSWSSIAKWFHRQPSVLTSYCIFFVQHNNAKILFFLNTVGKYAEGLQREPRRPRAGLDGGGRASPVDGIRFCLAWREASSRKATRHQRGPPAFRTASAALACKSFYFLF